MAHWSSESVIILSLALSCKHTDAGGLAEVLLTLNNTTLILRHQSHSKYGG